MMTTVLIASLLATNPRPLPYTYTYQTVAPGHLELEQFVDIIPVRVAHESDDGTLEGVMSARYKLITELELGITERLELGVYLEFEQGGGDAPLRFAAIKQRVRYRLFDQDELPVDIALYGEISESAEEIEFEQKIILHKRLGPVVLATNLWVEQEFEIEEGEWEFIYSPTLGASYELSPHVSVGLEGWLRGVIAEEVEPVNVFLGPVLMAQLGEYWASMGAYVRLDGLGDPVQIGESYGPLYLRLILGVGL